MTIAVCIEAPKIIVRRIVLDNAGIPKGTTLKHSGDNTAAASTSDGDAFAGITIEEKTADDGVTNIGVALDGVFKMDTTAAAINVGEFVSIGGSQQVAVTAGTADLVDGSQFGRAEETRDGDNRIRVRLGGV